MGKIKSESFNLFNIYFYVTFDFICRVFPCELHGYKNMYKYVDKKPWIHLHIGLIYYAQYV